MDQIAIASAGWSAASTVTAILAGLAALTGVAAMVMNWIMQRDQQSWQTAQESDRRSWQESQVVSTRWDDYKRRLYSEFVASADRLYELSNDLGDVQRHIAEDLVNHMPWVEEHFWETDGQKIKEMSEDARKDYWREKYEQQLTWFKERRSSLSVAESEVTKTLGQTVGELDLIAPDRLRPMVHQLSGLSRHSSYGKAAHDKEKEREALRGAFIEGARADLRVPGYSGA